MWSVWSLLNTHGMYHITRITNTEYSGYALWLVLLSLPNIGYVLSDLDDHSRRVFCYPWMINININGVYPVARMIITKNSGCVHWHLYNSYRIFRTYFYMIITKYSGHVLFDLYDQNVQGVYSMTCMIITEYSGRVLCGLHDRALLHTKRSSHFQLRDHFAWYFLSWRLTFLFHI
jgi:hypothetical protein